MKLRLLCGLMLTSLQSFAATPIDGLYAEVFGGYSYLPDNINTNLNGVAFNQVNYNSGYHGGGRFGYKDNPLRYEAEVIYISALPSQININQIQERNLSGQTNATAGLLNVYYDFPEVIPTLTPFLSGGIGYAYVSSNITGSVNNLTYQFRGSDNAFAYQGSAGLAYNFSNFYTLDVGYRYIGTTNLDQLGSTFQAHLASAGVTYRFDEGNYK